MKLIWRRWLSVVPLVVVILGQFCYGQKEENGPARKIFVAPYGNDEAAGTKQDPFATLFRARKEVRRSRNINPEDTTYVFLRGGDYRLRSTFSLGEEDSGNVMYPVIYSAYQDEEVRLNGGLSITVDRAKKVRKKRILLRLLPEVRDAVYQVNLKKAGISDFGKLRPRGFRRPYYPAAMELFVDKEAMTLARWPNTGLEEIDKVVEVGSVPRDGDYEGNGGAFSVLTDRLQRWKSAEDPWVSGFFHYGFADDALEVESIDVDNRVISTTQPTMYGFKDGDAHTGWYAFNLLEEIDAPGEYYINRETGMLYFYPPKTPFSSIELTVMGEPMIVLDQCSFVEIRNIVFESSRGMGVYMEEGENNLITDCVFRNLGSLAICVGRGIEPFKQLKHDGTGTPVSRKLGSWHEHIYQNPTFNRNAGKGHVIRNCHIYNTGSGGISLSGGDRLTLERGGNIVENCYIHDFNRLDRTYRSGINIDGVGNVIRHCEIAHCPASAIYLHGNDHIIEYNEIHHAVMTGDDMGAIYYGRDPSEFGTVVRYNLFHHLGTGDMRAGHRKIIGVYHDDGACGLTVTGNIFYKAGSRGANIGGGNDNIYTNNIFIDGKVAINHDNRLQGWASYMWEEGGIFEQRLKDVNYQEPPYSEAYPTLVNYFSDSPGLPKRNVVQYNLFWDYNMVYSGRDRKSTRLNSSHYS